MKSSFFDEDFAWMVHALLPENDVFWAAVHHNPHGGLANSDPEVAPGAVSQ